MPELAGRFAGIERADSLVIDPHKWLFAPLDCAALLYRDPAAAMRTHRQSAAYLDAFGDDHVNPSDLAFHLTRRTRGLPFWFALVVHGTDAFAAAVRAGLDLARQAADLVRAIGDPVRLVMEPELSVVLFERDGWARDDWDPWAAGALADGLAFVAPTRWHGRDVGRLVFLHPHTDLAAVAGSSTASADVTHPTVALECQIWSSEPTVGANEHSRRGQMSRRAKSSTAEPRSPRRKTRRATTASTRATAVPSSIAVAIALSAGVGEPRTVE